MSAARAVLLQTELNVFYVFKFRKLARFWLSKPFIELGLSFSLCGIVLRHVAWIHDLWLRPARMAYCERCSQVIKALCVCMCVCVLVWQTVMPRWHLTTCVFQLTTFCSVKVVGLRLLRVGSAQAVCTTAWEWLARRREHSTWWSTAYTLFALSF